MLDLILLQAEGAEQQQGTTWSFWIMLILIFVVFYFFLIRPKSKKQKELQNQREIMKEGDKDANMNGAEFVTKHNGNDEPTSVVASTPPDFTFCTNCGAKIPKGAKFCTSCGSPLNV